MSAWSEIGATLVGLGGLAFGWQQSGRTLNHERTLSDLAAVRDTVEEGAVYLHRVTYALDLVKQDLRGNAERAHAALNELGMTYDEILERLKVRLEPGHEVTQKFDGAVEATLDAARAVERVVVLHIPHLEQGGAAAKQAQVLFDKASDEIELARSRFDVHRADYIDAASRTIGARLPPAARGPGRR